jgi:16S rRNA (guanine(966)-N(2))-methyltransferase RsmD
MRIISGRYKSKRLFAPKNLPVRPTTDMAKESLFNILNNLYFFEDIKVLDLFAGIGSISLEFASRGTKNITSVDKNAGCIKFINGINDDLKLNMTLIKSDVYKFLKSNTSQKYDIIFADPPYDFEIVKFQNIIDLVFENEMLKENGMLIIEHASKTDLSKNKQYKQSRKYGGNMFSFFENEKLKE